MANFALLNDTESETGKSFRNKLFGLRNPFWFILPSLFFILLLTLYPALYAIYLSFTDASLVGREVNIIGFANYKELFTNREFYTVLKNTFIFVFSTSLGQVTLGFLFAYLTNKPYRGRVLVRTSLLLTWIIPEVIMALTFRWMFIGDKYGLINSIILRLGFDIRQLEWLAQPHLAMFVVIMMGIWRGTAFSMIIQLAGLQSIPNSLYEAAAIDGAGVFQNLRYITFPMIKQTLMVNIIFVTMWTFNVMGSIYVLTGGGPVRATEIIAISMYREAFKLFRLGYSSSIAIVMFVVNIIIALVYLRILRNREDFSN